MDTLTRELEEALIALNDGTADPPIGMSREEAAGEIQEELEEALMEDARRFLEQTKDLSPADQLASWRNWLYTSEGESYPWREKVYCEVGETPTMPSEKK